MRFVENIISGIIDHSKTLLYMFFVCIENARVKKVIVGALPVNWKLLPGISRRDQVLLGGHIQAVPPERGWELGALGITGSHWERGCAILGWFWARMWAVQRELCWFAQQPNWGCLGVLAS